MKEADVEVGEREYKKFDPFQLEAEIEKLSESLKQDELDKQREFVCLLQRSTAFSYLCKSVTTRPAVKSERNAMFGLDPTNIAELALKDAERACKLYPQMSTAYLKRGDALYLLELYEEAKEAYLSGLSIEPSNYKLQDALKEVQSIYQEAAKASRTLVARGDDLDCSLCLKLFCVPVTTSCGHTFCKSCLLRCMDYANRCPSCRTVLFITANQLSVNVTLQSLIEKSVPEECKQRLEEEKAAEGTKAGSKNALIPLFVMEVVIPRQKIALNIFEPRYRLLIRRAMNGSHTFGMVGIDRRTGDLLDVGCEVVISECDCLPDGRFHIEVVGGKRFKVHSSSEQDGYRLAKAEYFEDAKPEKLEDVFEFAKEVQTQMDEYIENLNKAADQALPRTALSRERRALLMLQAGPRPSNQTVPDEGWCQDVSFWVSNMLSNLRNVDKAALLRTTSTFDRLKLLKEALQQLEGSCVIQ